MNTRLQMAKEEIEQWTSIRMINGRDACLGKKSAWWLIFSHLVKGAGKGPLFPEFYVSSVYLSSITEFFRVFLMLSAVIYMMRFIMFSQLNGRSPTRI